MEVGQYSKINVNNGMKAIIYIQKHKSRRG